MPPGSREQATATTRSETFGDHTRPAPDSGRAYPSLTWAAAGASPAHSGALRPTANFREAPKFRARGFASPGPRRSPAPHTGPARAPAQRPARGRPRAKAAPDSQDPGLQPAPGLHAPDARPRPANRWARRPPPDPRRPPAAATPASLARRPPRPHPGTRDPGPTPRPRTPTDPPPSQTAQPRNPDPTAGRRSRPPARPDPRPNPPPRPHTGPTPDPRPRATLTEDREPAASRRRVGAAARVPSAPARRRWRRKCVTRRRRGDEHFRPALTPRMRPAPPAFPKANSVPQAGAGQDPRPPGSRVVSARVSPGLPPPFAVRVRGPTRRTPPRREKTTPAPLSCRAAAAIGGPVRAGPCGVRGTPRGAEGAFEDQETLDAPAACWQGRSQGQHESLLAHQGSPHPQAPGTHVLSAEFSPNSHQLRSWGTPGTHHPRVLGTFHTAGLWPAEQVLSLGEAGLRLQTAPGAVPLPLLGGSGVLSRSPSSAGVRNQDTTWEGTAQTLEAPSPPPDNAPPGPATGRVGGWRAHRRPPGLVLLTPPPASLLWTPAVPGVCEALARGLVDVALPCRRTRGGASGGTVMAAEHALLHTVLRPLRRSGDLSGNHSKRVWTLLLPGHFPGAPPAVPPRASPAPRVPPCRQGQPPRGSAEGLGAPAGGRMRGVSPAACAWPVCEGPNFISAPSLGGGRPRGTLTQLPEVYVDARRS
ncbi:basic proline-rich protein-like [Neovison vison]|uniref:basic proline-rich protein-like n=1 Tax=Neovison vison TaxID=452646 RepID=UPI001CF07BE6|nr:basic proline-rich protein-like [Neogale vison]